MAFYMFHAQHGARCFKAEADLEKLEAEGWVDSPAMLTDAEKSEGVDSGTEKDAGSTGSEDTDAAEPEPAADESTDADSTERDSLIHLAENNGIKIDKRWSDERLRKEVLG